MPKMPPPLKKILFIDDEENILSALKRLFRKESYDIITTTDPEEVFQHVALQDVALVVSDHRMPLMEGTKVLEKVKDLSPHTMRIMLTGYADLQATIDAVNKGEVWRFLTKPWEDHVLIDAVRQAVQHANLVKENKELTTLIQEQNAALKTFNAQLEEKVAARTKEVALLNEKVTKSLVESIHVMGELSELISNELGSHSKRVARLSEGIARNLNWSPDDLFTIMAAGYLHDIGKIGMTEKELKLSAQEYTEDESRAFAEHAPRGARLIGMISNLGDAALYILHHHERFDGKGFPDSLAGADIPEGARIITVADAYDQWLNLGENYKSTTPLKVLERIIAGSGSVFDPRIVKALVLYLKKSGQLEKDLYEVEISPFLLEKGHILAEDLHRSNGKGVLLTKDSKIDHEMLAALHKSQMSGQLPMTVHIYRRSIGKEVPDTP